MMWNIIGHSVYQLSVLIFLLFAGSQILGLEDGRNRDHKAPPTQHYTLIFNSFVFMQLGNQINSRKLYHEWNMFDGILSNRLFIAIELVEIVLQVIVVQFGGVWFRTTPLGPSLWILSIATGIGSFLVQVCIVAIARSITPYTTKPWLKEFESSVAQQQQTILSQVSSKLVSGLIGEIPDEEEIRRSEKPIGFRRNPTREFRDSKLFRN
jgi:magnesium-transporting ATPase (P-type)